jgi:acetyl esterase/lipase
MWALIGCGRATTDATVLSEPLLRGLPEPTIELRRPAGFGGALPTIVLLHGGAWIRGSRADMEPLAEAWIARGWAVVLPHYRLGPAAEPAATAGDVACALRWVHRRAAALRLDTARIVVAGASAGAHLAMLAATDAVATSPECLAGTEGVMGVSALVDWFGPVDLDSLDSERAGRALLHAWLGDDRSAAALRRRTALSALPGLRRHPPPLTVIVHAEADSVISLRHATLAAHAVREGGGSVEVITLFDSSHGLAPARWAAVDDSVFRLIEPRARQQRH